MKQAGFTLIELLVTLAIGSVILVGVSMSLQQIVWGTGRNNSQVVALTNVNQAALAIKKDLMMTQSTNLPDPDEDPNPQSSVTLSWTDYTGFSSENSTSHNCQYTLSGTVLQRTYDGVVSIVGRHITDLGFTQNGRVINVTITATGPSVPQRSATVEFSGFIRAEVIE
ncbi:MAG TPA: prepilin-type N-terminal cleavage/methylation domain-containing protein [Dehalococcoidales bacterium]|nr:prepilin-type N-terminal cleavage/methylation domain-containing protein [Dehalococcoidales bacterium]